MVMDLSAMSTDDVVGEVMKIHRSLPDRPGIDEVEAAKALIRKVETEDQLKLESIAKQIKGRDVPKELFKVLQEMQMNIIHLQSKEQKMESLKLLDLEDAHLAFDELIQRASKCVASSSSSPSSRISQSMRSSSGSSLGTSASFSTKVSLNSSVTLSSSSGFYGENSKEGLRGSHEVLLYSKDDTFLKKPKMPFNRDVFDVPQVVDHTLKPAITSGQDGERLSLIELASLIEVSAKKGTRELSLQGKLTDQIERIPDSIGKLSSVITLDLSENRIAILPSSIGGLSSLKTLDLHGNKISELPESIGNLLNLLNLNLRGNQLNSLPSTIDKLVRLQDLDLSSNDFSVLPDTIGSLVNLKKLNIETNDIEEIPHAIGRCTSLKEIHADYNRLKALPEAVGRIGSLEILTVRYNNIKQLPTTMASLTSLRELDISFNELESIPESLCFATTLVKMDISNNFADLQSLPRSIGNLEMLEELMINNNQIRVLPDSFGMLTKLRVLNVEGNPLSMPPRDVIQKGPQAVVQYTADVVAQRNVKSQPSKQKKSWAQKIFFSKSHKRQRYRLEYAKA